MPQKCNLCQQEKTLHALTVQDDDGEPYEIHLCDRCWDAIYAIATRAAKQVFHRLSKAN